MKQIVVGLGEVGSALLNILQCDGYDPNKSFLTSDPHNQETYPFFWRDGQIYYGDYDVLHVAFPYFDKFEETVREYQNLFHPKLTIIHSSVPVGTSREVEAVHSPIRGVHPYLEKGIRTFVKYFGGEKAEDAAKIFSDLGIKTKVTDYSETTEAAKLWDTTQYGISILLNKEIYKFCKAKSIDFDIVYTDFNKTYNEGYTKLGMPHVVRPYLKHMEGKIGGHCVVPNAKLLQSWVAKLLDNG